MSARRHIYLDYAASTPIDPRVLQTMLPCLKNQFGNSSSAHGFGQASADALQNSRETIADALKAKPGEIVFTSSVTESNNLALKGVAFARRKGHIIISSIEHDCVFNSARWLKTQGFKITEMPVDKHGLVSPAEIKKAIRNDTILVSIMHTNNEIGTIQPIKEIGTICKDKRVYFHTDATQSFGKIPLDISNVDLLSASSHKMYGPKGAAILYVRSGVKLEPIMHGGTHESGLRPSTVNVPAIVGFAKAVEICQKEMRKEARRLTRLRDKLIKGILTKIPDSNLSGHPSLRLPNNASFWFSRVEGESIVMQLDLVGVAASTGSACSSAKLEPSRALLATGLAPQKAHGSLRLSLGRWTTEKDINYVIGVLPLIIEKLRKISPFKS